MQTVTHVLLHTSPLLVYFVVALVLMLESTGVPVINSTLLLFTGALAAQGRLNIWELIVAAILGSITGAVVGYLVGAYGGRRVLLRLTRLLRIDQHRITLVERWFQRSGMWVVFLSRILPYLRTFACIPAGMTRMRFSTFFTCASLGSTIWCTTMLAVGWHLGSRWRLAVHLLREYTVPTLLGLALLLVIYYVISRAIKRMLLARLESSISTPDEQLNRDPLEI